MRVFQLRSCGTERAARPCSFDCDGSAQACDIHIDGAVERAELDADIPAVPASTQGDLCTTYGNLGIRPSDCAHRL
jgi:hypothetical protein